MPCRPGQQCTGKRTSLPGSRSIIRVRLFTCFSGLLRPRGKLQSISRSAFSIIMLNIFLCRTLRVAGDTGIVYCWRRVVCDFMAHSLNEAGLLACSHHAGMPDRDRESAQNKWKENECQVALFTLLLQKVVWCIGVV